MEKLGFCSKWVSLIVQCITSVSYSVLINGAAYGNITSFRGLRQGGPLSLGLFLLCAEGLSAIIHEEARNHLLTGISISWNCPNITNLFFADDSILFYKAKTEECQELKQIFRRYEDAFGQKINTNKSSVFFSPNTHQDLRKVIFAILRPMQDSKHSKYFGLPLSLEDQRNRSSPFLRSGLGKSLRGGRGSCSPWVERKFLLRRWLKLSSLTP